MPDWQAAAVRLADDYEELRQVHVAQQPIVEAATALVEEWEAIRNPADKLVWTIAEQLIERLAAAVREEGT